VTGSDESGRQHVADRIRQARSRLGLDPGVLADRLGLTFESYRDLEWFDDEAFTTISLAELLCLAEMLGTTAAELLVGNDVHQSRTSISMESLIQALRSQMEHEGISAEAFGDRVGWDITNALANPASAWDDWNVDCLIDVSTTLNVDWIAVLSSARRG
jgi:hypothetical protein